LFTKQRRKVEIEGEKVNKPKEKRDKNGLHKYEKHLQQQLLNECAIEIGFFSELFPFKEGVFLAR
jgi:hypothetical protein